jgi:hypothetical protein
VATVRSQTLVRVVRSVGVVLLVRAGGAVPRVFAVGDGLGVVAVTGVFVVPRIVVMGMVTAHWRLLPYGCFSIREYTPRGYRTSGFNHFMPGGIPRGPAWNGARSTALPRLCAPQLY